jgi:hypothetical protein
LDILKGLLLVSAFGLASLFRARPSRFAGGQVVIFVLAFELLIYQGRYIWNDLRDAVHDNVHPRRRARGRLAPPLVASRLQAGLAGLFARIAISVGLALVLWKQVGRGLLISGVAVWLLAVLYETLRRAVVRHNQVPLQQWTVSKVSLFFVLGLGYSIRAVAGLWLASGEMRLVFFLLTALFAGSLYIMTTCIFWTLEGSCFVPDNVGLPAAEYDRRLATTKPHYGPLLVQAGILARDAKASGAPLSNLGEQPVLSKPIERIGAVWNYACVLCCASGGWLGLGLASRFQAAHLGSMAPQGVAIGAISGLVTVLLRRGKLSTSARLLLRLVPLIAIAVVAWRHRIPWFFGAPILLLLVPLFYNGFWEFNYEQARRVVPILLASTGRKVQAALWLAMGVVFGPSTTRVLRHGVHTRRVRAAQRLRRANRVI